MLQWENHQRSELMLHDRNQKENQYLYHIMGMYC